MATPSYARSLVHLTKRLRLSPPTQTLLSQTRHISQSTTRQSTETTTPKSTGINQDLENIRLPRAVQAAYLTPLRRKPTAGQPSCDLQLRSYSVRNLEAFADFALRAAYYLNLAARGPVPLPRITERWTVPRSNFVHKKSQENYERITVRRLIQIQDGQPETVAVWLGFLKQYAYYGVGMKANVFEQSGLDTIDDLEAEADKIRERLGAELRGAVREANLESQTKSRAKKAAAQVESGDVKAKEQTEKTAEKVAEEPAASA